MEKDTDTRGIPAWNGAWDTFDTFAVECYPYRDTVEYDKRYLCGPMIARKLTGKAAVALLGRPQGWLNRHGGVENLATLSATQSRQGGDPRPRVPHG